MKTKTESNTERIVCEAIVEYCVRKNIKRIVYEPKGKNTASDYGLELTKADGSISKINLEVTEAFGYQIHEDSNIPRKCRPQDPLKGFRKKFNSLDNSWIKTGEILIVYFRTEILSKKEAGISLCELIRPLHKKI